MVPPCDAACSRSSWRPANDSARAARCRHAEFTATVLGTARGHSSRDPTDDRHSGCLHDVAAAIMPPARIPQGAAQDGSSVHVASRHAASRLQLNRVISGRAGPVALAGYVWAHVARRSIEVAHARLVLVVLWLWATVAAGRFSAPPSSAQALQRHRSNTDGPRTSGGSATRLCRERYLRRCVTPIRRPASRARSTGRRRIRDRRRPATGARAATAPGRRTLTTTPRGTSEFGDEAGGGQPDLPRPATTAARMPAGKAARTTARNLTCTTCHSVHSPKSPEQQLVQADRDAALRDVPPAAGGQDRTRGRAHAGARRQDGVHARATTRTARSATSRT